MSSDTEKIPRKVYTNQNTISGVPKRPARRHLRARLKPQPPGRGYTPPAPKPSKKDSKDKIVDRLLEMWDSKYNPYRIFKTMYPYNGIRLKIKWSEISTIIEEFSSSLPGDGSLKHKARIAIDAIGILEDYEFQMDLAEYLGKVIDYMNFGEAMGVSYAINPSDRLKDPAIELDHVSFTPRLGKEFTDAINHYVYDLLSREGKISEIIRLHGDLKDDSVNVDNIEYVHDDWIQYLMNEYPEGMLAVLCANELLSGGGSTNQWRRYAGLDDDAGMAWSTFVDSEMDYGMWVRMPGINLVSDFFSFALLKLSIENSEMRKARFQGMKLMEQYYNDIERIRKIIDSWGWRYKGLLDMFDGFIDDFNQNRLHQVGITLGIINDLPRTQIGRGLQKKVTKSRKSTKRRKSIKRRKGTKK